LGWEAIGSPPIWRGDPVARDVEKIPNTLGASEFYLPGKVVRRPVTFSWKLRIHYGWWTCRAAMPEPSDTGHGPFDPGSPMTPDDTLVNRRHVIHVP
jgi:hypothetical protein